jgi:hypothetical protein
MNFSNKKFGNIKNIDPRMAYSMSASKEFNKNDPLDKASSIPYRPNQNNDFMDLF